MSATPGRATRTARRPPEDDAVAGAVGLVLVLALVVTYYAHELQAGVPEKAREAERAWQDRLEASLAETAARMAAGEPAAVAIPGPVDPEPVVVPLLGSARAAPATAMLRTEQGCATLTASHAVDNRTIVDLNATRTTCFVVEAEGAYERVVRYVVELGALVRVEQGRAVILAGPPLHFVREGGGSLRASLGAPLLEAPAEASSLAPSGARLQMVPLPSGNDIMNAPNADNVTWRIETRHPAAWEAWLRQQTRAAGLGPTEHAIVCDQPGCGLDATGRGNVTLVLHGPTSTAGAKDITLSLPMQRMSLRAR